MQEETWGSSDVEWHRMLLLLVISRESTGFESSEECPEPRVRSEKCPCTSCRHCTFGPWYGSAHAKPPFMAWRTQIKN